MPRCPALRTIGVAIVVGMMPCATTAQPVTRQVAVSGGSATDERGTRSDAVSVASQQGVAIGAHALLTLSANGTQYGSAAWQAGAAAQLATRTASWGPWALSLNGSGAASRSSYNASFWVADATPALEWTTGPVTWFGGGHVASSRTSVPAAPTPLPLGSPGRSDVSRTSAGPVYGMQWQVSGAESPVVASVSLRGEHARVGRETVVDRAAGVQVEGGMLTLGGSVGDRSAPTERTRYAGVSMAVRVMRTVSVELATGRYPSNRLTNAAGGRYVTAGVAFTFGGGATMALPEPAGAGAPPPGYTRLSIRAPAAERVDVYGDWNGWTALPARRAANGVWYVDVALQPGEYRYAFRVNRDAWRVPEQAATATDDFGGESAFVTVPRRPDANGR